MHLKSLRGRSGFTLVELLVVVAILGLLGVAVIVSLNPAQRFTDTRTNTAKQDVKTAGESIERCITTYLSANTTATETTAIANCDTAAEVGITVGTNQALNAKADNTSLCFSELTGTAGVYVKYVHTAGTGGVYSENAASACILGV